MSTTNVQTDLKNAVKETMNNLPGLPSPELETIFKLKFKKGQISQEVFFKFIDNQRKAEMAAREYCARFKFRFIWVEKFFQDINAIPTVDAGDESEEREFITAREKRLAEEKVRGN